MNIEVIRVFIIFIFLAFILGRVIQPVCMSFSVN